MKRGLLCIALACCASAAQAQVLDRQALAERLAGCAAVFDDMARAYPDASRTVRVQYSAKNYASLAMRLGEKPQIGSVLGREKKAIAERRADPAQAKALDEAFEQRDVECNRLLEHNMALIDSLRDGR